MRTRSAKIRLFAALLVGLGATLTATTPAVAAETADALPFKLGDNIVQVGCTWNNGCYGGYHTGTLAPAIDFLTPVGTAVYAAGPGTVVSANGSCTTNCDDRGRFVEISHPDGRHSRYLHLSSVTKASGAVGRGDLIGYSGDTMANGVPHLHYDETIGGSKVDPGSMSAKHGNSTVSYPSDLNSSYTSWSHVPQRTRYVWSDGVGGGEPVPASKRADIVVTGSDNIWAVATSNGSSFEGSGHWLTGWGKGDWTGFADVNGDGKSDVVVHDPAARAFKVALSNGAGSFNGAGTWFSDWGIGDWTGLADVTGDGKADLITNDGSVWLVAFSTGSSFTGFGVGLNGWPKGDWAGLADANGDGKADIIVHDPINATFSVAISGGTGMFGSPGTGTWLWGWGSGDWVGVADITGDKKADLVVHGPDDKWAVATSSGSSFMGFGIGLDNWGKGDFTALADANGDGKADIIVHNPQNATFAVAISGGSGYFGSPGTGVWLSGWGAGSWAAAGDVNNN